MIKVPMMKNFHASTRIDFIQNNIYFVLDQEAINIGGGQSLLNQYLFQLNLEKAVRIVIVEETNTGKRVEKRTKLFIVKTLIGRNLKEREKSQMTQTAVSVMIIKEEPN